MNDEDLFAIWMKGNSQLSDNTISKYSRAIISISKDIETLTGRQFNVYKINDLKKLEEVKNKCLNTRELNEKNRRGNSMYSCALGWYGKYLESKDDNVLVGHSEVEVEYRRKPLGPSSIRDGVERWTRDPEVKNRMIMLSGNRCEYNPCHENFMSKSGKNYVEGHHLIPMEYQGLFDFSLDVEANLVSLCVVCHKMLHFGKTEDKVPVLEKLFSERQKRLESSGLFIEFHDLKEFYK